MWSTKIKQEVEQKRRQRAELRRTYGNLVSSINISLMRHKQKALEAQAQENAAKQQTAEEPPEENSLRRIASSFAHVRDLQNGLCNALPPDDSEQDAKEERAEVLICSQAMPLPTAESTLSMVDSTPSVKPLELPPAHSEEDDSEAKLAKLLPYTLQVESRATERWQRLGSTVSALFRARRNIDGEESPMAQTRRLREQRELLETFTRPFLYEPSTRDYPEIGAQKLAEGTHPKAS